MKVGHWLFLFIQAGIFGYWIQNFSQLDCLIFFNCTVSLSKMWKPFSSSLWKSKSERSISQTSVRHMKYTLLSPFKFSFVHIYLFINFFQCLNFKEHTNYKNWSVCFSISATFYFLCGVFCVFQKVVFMHRRTSEDLCLSCSSRCCQTSRSWFRTTGVITDHVGLFVQLVDMNAEKFLWKIRHVWAWIFQFLTYVCLKLLALSKPFFFCFGWFQAMQKSIFYFEQ